jgi:hypothetical protein
VNSKKVVCIRPSGLFLTLGKTYEVTDSRFGPMYYDLIDDLGRNAKTFKNRFDDAITITIPTAMNVSQPTIATATNTTYPKKVKCINNGSMGPSSSSNPNLTVGKIYTATGESSMPGQYTMQDDLGRPIEPFMTRFVDADAMEIAYGEENRHEAVEPKIPKQPQQPYISTLKDAMLYDMQMKKPKFEGQALQWHKEGRCPQCGCLGPYSQSVAVCPVHGVY